MKRKLFTALLLVCTMLCSCGHESYNGSEDDSTAEQIQSSESVESVTEESSLQNEAHTEQQDKAYTINKIDIPDVNTIIEEMIPAGYIKNNDMCGLAYGTLYRFFNIESLSDDSLLGSCILTLEAPYTEWECHMVKPEEWVEGESCQTGQCTITDYGTLYVLLEGSEDYYLGKWSLAKGLSAEKLECEYQIYNHENWCAGDNIGNYFLYMDWESIPDINYQMLWLDSDFEQKEGLPEEGYVWKVAETFYSGTPYLFGMDAAAISITGDDSSVTMSIPNKGFTIWAENQDEPVFTTPHTGMSYDDVVLFSSDTDGYLLNTDGIWNFSIENQSITKIRDDNRIWYDAYLKEDGSLLLLSQYYDPNKNIDSFNQFDYYLWEMIDETID